jgi:formamidase
MMRVREFHFDVRRSLLSDPSTGHNRMHPDIEPVASVVPGDLVSIDLRDGFDAQIGRDSTVDDVVRLDLVRGHAMTGPFEVEGAEPGDLLDVEIVGIEPSNFGYTIVMPGIGLLGHRLTRHFFVKWHLEDGVARSDDLPGIAVRGSPFLGVVAVAPSAELVATATERERALMTPDRLVMLPDPTRAVPAYGPPATEGLRTLPPRENGGNLDVKYLRAGSRVTFAVGVAGARCSFGDPHFAQGDGESCGLAIETSARVKARFGVRKPSQAKWRPRYPAIEFTEPANQMSRRFFATTGIPVDASGRNHYLDVYCAAQAAAGEMVDYLTAERGLSEEQAYVILSVAVDLHISEIVDEPNTLVSAVLPLDIFDEG